MTAGTVVILSKRIVGIHAGQPTFGYIKGNTHGFKGNMSGDVRGTQGAQNHQACEKEIAFTRAHIVEISKIGINEGCLKEALTRTYVPFLG